MSVLVTGATGFVGSVLLERLDDAVALVRGRGRVEGARELEGDLLRELPAFPGDVTAVVHCAASVSFTLPLEQARAINVEGTRRVLEAAAALPRLERFVHVSTAYVAGDGLAVFGEDDTAAGAPRNTYEQTKWEAEALVRSSGLEWSIVRPSIVVGDSRTGETSAFNVLYFPLQAFARGLISEVPADPDAVVDVVPVDHVADVIEAALGGAGPVLHAVAAEHAVSAGELAALASGAFDRPPPRFAPDAAPDGLEAYFPYFTVRTRFAAERARSLGLEPPPLGDYFERIVEYAVAARWGRSVRRQQPARAA